MSVNEYCDFVESTSLYTGISAFELNMEYCFEIGLISNEMYERAKAELLERRRVDVIPEWMNHPSLN
jgi:hypothetical protein